MDATIEATDSDMFDLLSGKVNPQIALLKVSITLGVPIELHKFCVSEESQDQRKLKAGYAASAVPKVGGGQVES